MPNKTIKLASRWVWELYPYPTVYPGPTDNFPDEALPNSPSLQTLQAQSLPQPPMAPSFVGQGALLPSEVNQSPTESLTGAILGTSNIVSQLAIQIASPNQPDYKKEVRVGIKNISINREKSSPASLCHITVLGPPSPYAYAGVWCCLTTVLQDGKSKRVRFIGQISDVSVTYQTQSSGLVSVVTAYSIREWSASLMSPLRVEAANIALEKKGETNASGLLVGLIGQNNLTQIAPDKRTVFDTAALFLQFAGAISQKNAPAGYKALADLGFSSIAGKMPQVPAPLLARLGLKSDQGMWASGFVKMISGVYLEPWEYLTEGWDGSGWDGLFDANGPSVPSIDDYASSHLSSQEETGRPFARSIQTLMVMNSPVWDLIKSFCDPGWNEFYTDMLYEIDDDGKERVQPVIVFRDIPFLLEAIRDEMPSYEDPIMEEIIDRHTTYDSLPRIEIESAAIASFSIQNSIRNSKNLLRIEPASSGLVKKNSSDFTDIRHGYMRLPAEMSRFGGQDFALATNFTDLSSEFSSSQAWAHVMRDLTVAWYAYDYRFFSGQLSIKDYNSPISLGMNVQFQIGNFVLVGHVEAINFSVMADDRGAVQNFMNISLSHIVRVDEDGDLNFITPNQIGHLNNPETEPEDADPVNFPEPPFK